MYTVTKEFTFDYAHRLILDYPSKCSNIHGHTGKVQLTIASSKLLEEYNDILINFVDLKEFIDKIKEDFDHKLILNEKDKEIIEFMNKCKCRYVMLKSNPTSETFARIIAVRAAGWLNNLLPTISKDPVNDIKDMIIKVTFWETPTSFATYHESYMNLIETFKRYDCKRLSCKCKTGKNKDSKCNCKSKENSSNNPKEYVKVSVVHTKNLVPVSEETARRMAERGMLLGTLKKKSECKKEGKKETNKDVKKVIKPLVNSILRDM